jgi:hypothetical protein
VTASGWTVTTEVEHLASAKGWTALLYRRVTGSEPASHTFDYGLTATAHGIVVIALRGAESSGDPFAAVDDALDETADTAWTVPGLTMSAQPAMLLSTVSSTRGDHTINTLSAWPTPHRGLALMDNTGSTAGFSAGEGAGYIDAADPASFGVTAESTSAVLGVAAAVKQEAEEPPPEPPAAPTIDLATGSDTGPLAPEPRTVRIRPDSDTHTSGSLTVVPSGAAYATIDEVGFDARQLLEAGVVIEQ